jgi:N-acetylneuraminic acid mutarotase
MRLKHAPLTSAGGALLLVLMLGTHPAWSQSDTPAWQRVADLPTARLQLGAAVGADGRIYAIGGALKPGVGPVEAYDPSTDSWAPVASLLGGRQGPAVVAGADGRIYAIGGSYTDGPTPPTSVEAYDPATDAWTRVADLPRPRSRPAAALGPDERIYVFGGYSPDAVWQRAVLRYDTTTDTWETLASTPPLRPEIALSGPDGRIYVLASTALSPNAPDGHGAIEMYDPVADAWSVLTGLPTERWEAAVAMGPDGLIYVIGGVPQGGWARPGERGDGSTEAYDPSENTWVGLGRPPFLFSGQAAVTAPDGRIYVIGGFGGGSNDASIVQRYTPGADAPVPLGTVPAPSS